ncbi:unnamed protein product [Ilex paraguariensis]|uniref:Uncharacterized protein n=1 Tax=Ilex paraguariensis TaxID=185542 RepID=A0ABC8UWG1_9AQUA
MGVLVAKQRTMGGDKDVADILLALVLPLGLSIFVLLLFVCCSSRENKTNLTNDSESATTTPRRRSGGVDGSSMVVISSNGNASCDGHIHDGAYCGGSGEFGGGG